MSAASADGIQQAVRGLASLQFASPSNQVCREMLHQPAAIAPKIIAPSHFMLAESIGPPFDPAAGL
jgi:hypothetical protein